MPEPVVVPKELSVAIVGGGMGGLAAGVALGRAGVKVDLFEQAPKFEVRFRYSLYTLMLTDFFGGF